MTNNPRPAPPRGIQWVRSIYNIDAYRLDNGLQLLLVPHDDTPTQVSLCCRVGARHENYGETGMAHLLEHMVFKGSTKIGSRVLSKFDHHAWWVNAETMADCTNFHATFAPERAQQDTLLRYLGWLGDMLNQQSFISQHHLDSEKIVVRNEMQMGKDRPAWALQESVRAAMFKWHNYGNDIIGSSSDIEHAELQQLKAFYQRHYRPDNATLIVTGHIDSNWLLEAVNATFGPIETPDSPRPRQRTVEPPQQEELEVVLYRPGRHSMLLAAYRAPGITHPDTAATRLLERIMLLRLRVALDSKAHSVESVSFQHEEAGAIGFLACMEENVDVDAIRQLMLATIESGTAISQEECLRARRAWLDGWENGTRTPGEICSNLLAAVALGDWRLHFLLRDNVHDCKLADMRLVAANLFRATNRTFGCLLPGRFMPTAWPDGGTDLTALLRDYQCAWVPGRVSTPPSGLLSQEDIEARTRHFTLNGGMRVAALASSLEPDAAAVLQLHFGDPASLTGQCMFAQLLAQLLNLHDFDIAGARIHAEANLPTQLEISIEAGEARPIYEALRHTAQLLQSGDWITTRRFERARSHLTSRLVQLPFDAINAGQLLGTQPYRPTPAQSLRELAVLDGQCLRTLMRDLLGANNARLGIYGCIDLDSIVDELAPNFTSWIARRPQVQTPPRDLSVTAPGQRRFLLQPEQHNATMAVQADLAFSRADDDFPCLSVINRLLGNSPDSRLWQRLREQDGLTYNTTSSVRLYSGYLFWQSQTDFAPQHLEQVEQAFDDELARALKNGFNDEELRNARLYFDMQRQQQEWERRQPSLQLPLLLAKQLAEQSEQDTELTPADYRNIAQLTLGDIDAALRRNLQPERMVKVFVGNF
jgi:zinc protease